MIRLGLAFLAGCIIGAQVHHYEESRRLTPCDVSLATCHAQVEAMLAGADRSAQHRWELVQLCGRKR